MKKPSVFAKADGNVRELNNKDAAEVACLLRHYCEFLYAAGTMKSKHYKRAEFMAYCLERIGWRYEHGQNGGSSL